MNDALPQRTGDRGMTLIEIVVVTALLALIFSFVLLILSQSSTLSASSLAQQDALVQAQQAGDRVTGELRMAQAASLNLGEGATANTLTFQRVTGTDVVADVTTVTLGNAVVFQQVTAGTRRILERVEGGTVRIVDLGETGTFEVHRRTENEIEITVVVSRIAHNEELISRYKSYIKLAN